MLSIEEIAEHGPSIDPEAKYWFVRTDGGKLYEAFITTHSIAIGYANVTLDFIDSLDDTDDEESKEELKEELRKFYPAKETEDGPAPDLSGLHASQILRFCKEMKRGDIVVIPSERAERLAVGIIDDDGPFEELLAHKGKEFSEYTKRRKVNWIRGEDKHKINPNLFKLFLNQQTIVDASNYSEWIDALLYEFFRKGDVYHYVIKVGTTRGIRAQALFGACLGLFQLVDEFAKENDIDAGTENIETRISLNSPGDIEIWNHGIGTIALAGMFIVFLNGGGFTIKKLGVSLKTDGLIKKIQDFLNERHRRKVAETVREKLETLDIKSPEQLVSLIEATKK